MSKTPENLKINSKKWMRKKGVKSKLISFELANYIDETYPASKIAGSREIARQLNDIKTQKASK